MCRLQIAILLLLIGVPGLPALAAQTTDFEQGQFAAAQKDGRPILIDIRASWCPTCAAQKPIIERLTAAPE